MSAVAVRPAAAQSIDESVRAAVTSGSSTRVIMQFATTAARDAAFNRLLDGGAAVRATETEVGPALVVIGGAAILEREFSGATQISADASVTVLSTTPARARSPRRSPTPSAIREAASYSGPAVAIIDSGIQPHADLPLSRIRVFKDFVAGGRSPVDGCGHGTHVAGIVAGSGASSGRVYQGIAPDVDVVALRVLGNDCSGRTSDVIDALEWVARNHTKYKIRVVNLSLGHDVLESIFTDPLVQAVERLSRRGVVVVTAAGNKGINPKTGEPGYGGVGVPCNAPSSVCVGALDTQGTPALDDDAVARKSSRGPTRFDFLAKPDLVAPGVNIISLAAPGSMLFTNYPTYRVDGGNTYFKLSGTSMASPAVAGAAVRLLQANQGLSANAVKMALQFTARILDQTDVLTQGAGALNLAGAVTLASAINPSAPLGSNWLTTSVATFNSDANGEPITWGGRIIYGDRFMQPRYAGIHLFRWSDDIVWAYDALADNIVWGNNGDNIVWGNDDNIVWGNEDNIVWGNDDNIVWGNLEDANIVWGNGESDNIVWGIDDNIVWGNDDNIVWGNTDDDNIVWGNGFVREVWAANIVWGFWDDNIVWGNVSRDEVDNIVWGNDDNIVWGNCAMGLDDNIVWGNDDNIVWGNGDNIVWGNGCSRLNAADDNIVWGNRVLTGGVR
ncbi:MAG: S8 family peptidase [Vicinamibacterales bacterium]|jgi:serine protease AprX